MQGLIETCLGKNRPFLSLWLAVGSLFAISFIHSLFSETTSLEDLASLQKTLGLPQAYADWFAGVSSWLDAHREITSDAVGLFIGVGIITVILYSETMVKPSGPAGATLFVAIAVAQEVGVNDSWWITVVILPVFVLLCWTVSQRAETPHVFQELGGRVFSALMELIAVTLALPMLIFGIFYIRRPRDRGARP